MSTSQKSSTLDASYTVSYRGVMVFWESQVVDVKMADEFIEQKSHIHDQPQTSLPFKKYLIKVRFLRMSLMTKEGLSTLYENFLVND